MSDEQGYVDPNTGEIHVPNDQPGTDVEVVPTGPAVPAIPDKFVQLRAMMQDAEDRAAMSPEEIQASIVERILGAATIDDVFAIQEARHARDLLDVPIEVVDFKFQESTFDEGAKYYVVLDAFDVSTGEKMAVTCGGATVVAQLYRLGQLGAFPIKVKFAQTKRPTKSGKFPMSLEPAV
jgi:hypothetical protein